MDTRKMQIKMKSRSQYEKDGFVDDGYWDTWATFQVDDFWVVRKPYRDSFIFIEDGKGNPARATSREEASRWAARENKREYQQCLTYK